VKLIVSDEDPTAQMSVGDRPETALRELSPAPTFGLATALKVEVHAGTVVVVTGASVGIRF
jgi:hypothetical protein